MELESTVAPPLFFSTATAPVTDEFRRDTPPLLEFIVKLPTAEACSTVTPAVFDVNDTAPVRLLPWQEDVPFPMIRGSCAELAVSDPVRFVLQTSSVTPLLKLTVPVMIAPCASKEPPASTVTVPTWEQPAGMRTD